MFQYFDKAKFIFRCEISFWFLFVVYVYLLVTFIKEFSPQKNEILSQHNQSTKLVQNNHFLNDDNNNYTSLITEVVKAERSDSNGKTVPIDRVNLLPDYQKVLLEKLEQKIQFELQNNGNFSQVSILLTLLSYMDYFHPRATLRLF
jgi:hypothetical protein